MNITVLNVLSHSLVNNKLKDYLQDDKTASFVPGLSTNTYTPNKLYRTNTPSPLIMTGMNLPESRRDDMWIAQLEKIVEENLKHPNFTVEWLSLHMSISRRQLYRKIKILTGVTPKKYIQEKRLQKAYLLLDGFNAIQIIHQI